MPRILGIDPGIRQTGWGILDAEGPRHLWVASGVIRPDPGMELPRRLLAIEEALTALLEEHRPELAAIEDVFIHKNAKSALILGQAQAAALLAPARRGIPLHFYAPREVKLALTGQGGADKQQVRFMVERILGRRFGESALDETDALALAICGAGRTQGVGA